MGNHNKRFVKDVRKFLNELGYKLISNLNNDEYIKNSEKLLYKDDLNYTYYTNLNSIQQKHIPAKFHIANPYTIQNIKLWCKLNNKSFELLSERYIGSDKYLKWKCLKEECGEVFEANWECIYNQSGCSYCTGQKAGLSNCLATKNPELAKEWHPTKNGDLTPYDVTYGSGKSVWWLCKEYGHDWEAVICERNRKDKKSTGCPTCSESKGEKKIKETIILYNDIYCGENEYTFDDLMGMGGCLLRYDVPVFDDKDKTRLIMLIEYDGEFHYNLIKNYKKEPIELAKCRLEKQQYHDKLKNEYCIKNNITLVRIPYWDFDNIETILDNILNQNNLASKYIVNNQ